MLHIQDHLEDEPSLDQLARLSHFSPYHFHRIFSAFVGESVFKHIRRLRLEAAARRLRQTDRSVTEIALEAGYGAHEAFTRAFKAMFGVSPSRFRKDRGVAAPASSFGAVESGQALLAGEGLMKVKIERTDAMRIAFIRHLGPYAELGVAYRWLYGQWLPTSGREPADGPPFEVYLNNPEDTPPDELITEIHIPLKPR